MPSQIALNADQLSTIISHALAPAFLIGAVVGLASILITRITGITVRIRDLNQIADDDAARAWLKADIPHLKQREKLLNSALQLALAGAICITVLLLVGFVSAFLGYRHEPGAGVLFVIALCLLGGSLYRFLQDLRVSVTEHDHHH